MEMVTAALIGLGNIAWKYDANAPANTPVLTHAGAMRRNSAIRLAGACSPDVGDRQAFVSWMPGVETFSSHEEMLWSIRPDLVGICSPAEEHFTHVQNAIQAGVKAIWLEKPAAASLEELAELISMSEKAGTKILVNFTRRYNHTYSRLRELFKTEFFDTCHCMRILYSPGLSRNGIHLLDQLFYISGADDYDLLWVEKGGRTSPSFALRLSTGQLAVGVGADLPYHTNDISLICRQGCISVLRGGKIVAVEKSDENVLFPGFCDLHDVDAAQLGFDAKADDYMEAALNDLLESLHTDGRPRSNLNTAYVSQKLADAILAGAER